MGTLTASTVDPAVRQRRHSLCEPRHRPTVIAAGSRRTCLAGAPSPNASERRVVSEPHA